MSPEPIRRPGTRLACLLRRYPPTHKPHIQAAGNWWVCSDEGRAMLGPTPRMAYVRWATRPPMKRTVYFSATPNPMDWTPTEVGVIP